MKVPNAESAVVDIRKLTDYCLSHEHPRGRHKARVFQAALGLTVVHAAEMRDVLLERVRTVDCVAGNVDEYGARYIVDFDYARGDKKAILRSTWIVKFGEHAPHLTSFFVL